MGGVMLEKIKSANAYHEATKHHFDRYARGPGYLDWASQPDPFRRYDGAPIIALEKVAPVVDPPTMRSGPRAPSLRPRSTATRCRNCFWTVSPCPPGNAPDPRPGPCASIFFGNLHPVEGYLVCGALEGLCSEPMVAHYAPEEHLLERRLNIPPGLWQRIAAGISEDAFFVGITFIHWRESWKYGERAYRYCQLDLGHALGAFGVRPPAWVGGSSWWIRGFSGGRPDVGGVGCGRCRARRACEPAVDCAHRLTIADWSPDNGFSAASAEMVELPWPGEAQPLESYPECLAHH